MNIIPKSLLMLFFVLLLAEVIKSQPKTEYILKQDFVPILDSLIMPPSNCDEAMSLMILDSTGNKYIKIPLLDEQELRIQKIFTELSANVNGNKSNRLKSMQPPDTKAPPGNGPPGGFGPPPEIGDIQSEFLKMKDDLYDANIAVDKITVEKEKFKDELTLMQSNVNDKLHETLESDEKARESIINEFLRSGVAKYIKYKKTIRVNLLILDDIVRKYGYGSKVRTILLKSEILNLQLAEAGILKLLVKVTNEFVNIGAKYHR